MIKRFVTNDVLNHRNKREITLLVGARQVGKTTIMKDVQKILLSNKERTVFLSLDNENDRRFFNSQELLLQKIRLEFGNKNGVVFIDEIQRKENAGLFLKGLYDMDLPYKFIVSGSGSLELKEKIHESLAGRKLLIEIAPINFYEFVDYRTNYKYSGHLEDFFSIESEKTSIFLMEYLNFGGYPRVITEETIIGKNRIIDEIYKSYLERDIPYLIGLEKSEEFSALLKIIASQVGSLVNYNELASTLGLAAVTVKKYLWYMENTFIINKVSPFFKNIRKEITKAPVYYFTDLGLRNYAINNFGRVDEKSKDSGFLFENFIYKILRNNLQYTSTSLNFWRTRDGAEVDFILNKQNKVIPVEVKFQELTTPNLPRSLQSFINKYKPENVYLINKKMNGKIVNGNTSTNIIPFWKTTGIK
jgi:hypothetical protein